MSKWQLLLFILVICQRLVELLLAHRNAKWIQKQGGYEVGKEHYPLFIYLHILFFVGIWFETKASPRWWILPFLLFIFSQAFRIWAIYSLGRFWNTRIWVVPNRLAQVQGPYRYIRHPNYLVVIIELLVFPLIYQAYLTAILISLLHVYLLFRVRIPIEEQALHEATNYQEVMKEKNRLFPIWKHPN